MLPKLTFTSLVDGEDCGTDLRRDVVEKVV
jgi:hypothetical protein